MGVMKAIRRFLRVPESHFFLFGPRGTGKSTWLKETLDGAVFLDFLKPATQRTFQARPERFREFVDGHPAAKTFVVDEVQRCPALLDVVHSLIEEHRGVQFVLTGSSARKLRKAGVDLLAGRALKLSMHPFMAAELGDGFDLGRALENGLLPVVHGARSAKSTLDAYLDLYVREEVLQEGLVRSLDPFARFLEAAAFSHGSQLVSSAIARECQVGRTTVDGYLKILEDLLIAARLPVFAKRARRELVAHEKFYFFDAGVFRALRPKGPLDRPSEIDGAALEGLVFQHLRAWKDYSGGRVTLGYWRTKAGVEVDFVVYGERDFAAIEVKNAAVLHPGDFTGLKAFREDYPEVEAVLLYRGTERFRRDGVMVVPVEEFLRELVPGRGVAPGGGGGRAGELGQGGEAFER
jgi:predicted AAA+ superfamily ATPase